jgi:hypothetical protein
LRLAAPLSAPQDDEALHKLFMQNDNLEAAVMEATAALQLERLQAAAA